jgi:hypothetical protein
MAIEITSATPEELSGIRDALSVPSKNVFDQKNSLPAPNISFKGVTTIQGLSGNPKIGNTDLGIINEPINLYQSPHLLVSDFSQEFLENNQIFIEMVIFNKSRIKYEREGRSSKTGFFVSNGTSIKPWGNFWNRSGISPSLSARNITRYNHLPVINLNEYVDLGICLNNHFILKNVEYITHTGKPTIDLMVPCRKGCSEGGQHGYKHPHGKNYVPLYIAFRYIHWLSNLNNGKGQIVSGPLSKTIKVKNTFFPFNKDPEYTSIESNVCKLNDNFSKFDFVCTYC